METAITSALVGTLEFDTAKGFGAHVTTNDAARRSLWLNIFDEVSSEPGLLAGVAPVIDDLHGLTDAARSALRESLAQDEEVVEFVRFHVEEIENLEEDLGAKLNAFLSGDGRPDLVANVFQVDSLVFRKDADGALAFWLDFALAPEFSDEVLCVEFDHSRTVTRVSWES
ncbi:DUF2004 domain-containing protein [Streptomyces sp. NPDC047725]|uniref:DUF2004 domain-containing protein n=1 Tax=Streptomyces sp. NPDC047725 TaxID=3365487 RepID=UPI00371EBB6E